MRRRDLRRRKRKELLLNLWRTVALLVFAGGLGWVLLRFGWLLKTPNQVLVKGSSEVSPTQLLAVGNITLPHPLLEVNPADLEQQLRGALPVHSVKVKRSVLPAQLEVEMQAHQPFAKATRRIPGGIALGMVSADGDWIQPNPMVVLPAPTTTISVVGWTEESRNVVGTLLRLHSRLGDTLQSIELLSDGSVRLRCDRLGQIELGDRFDQLPQQITAINLLNQKLPAQVLEGKGGWIDLSNPERPEIKRPVKAASAVSKGTVLTAD